jgi:hypothetical protein
VVQDSESAGWSRTPLGTSKRNGAERRSANPSPGTGTRRPFRLYTAEAELSPDIGFRFPGFFPSDELLEVVAEGTLGAELLPVEQAHGAAPEANLVRVSLQADRPAHFAVPP